MRNGSVETADVRRHPNAPAALRAVLRACAFLGVLIGHAFAADSGLTQNVTFTDYSPLSRSSELARRFFAPLSYQSIAKHFEGVGAQPVDLAQEKFVVYVPEGEPPREGYGLLVFIPPWPQAALPKGWSRALDRHGLIFVSAANSGNEASTLDRRVPLALLAYENIRRSHTLDEKRVYVGGMSGGSRVALRVALAYPDVFRGALLNAGSDPIGEGAVVLPPADLFRRFQESTRLVYLTGARDEVNVSSDLKSMKSLRDWCVFDVHSETMARRGHEIADVGGLERALDDLERPAAIDAGKLAACRLRIERELSSKQADAEAALARGDRDRAIEAMKGIDERFGGAAAAAIAGLQAKLGTP
jgi:pimeloyl-ACP methyl ester carboxylesterase